MYKIDDYIKSIGFGRRRLFKIQVNQFVNCHFDNDEELLAILVRQKNPNKFMYISNKRVFIDQIEHFGNTTNYIYIQDIKNVEIKNKGLLSTLRVSNYNRSLTIEDVPMHFAQHVNSILFNYRR